MVPGEATPGDGSGRMRVELWVVPKKMVIWDCMSVRVAVQIISLTTSADFVDVF